MLDEAIKFFLNLYDMIGDWRDKTDLNKSEFTPLFDVIEKLTEELIVLRDGKQVKNGRFVNAVDSDKITAFSSATALLNGNPGAQELLDFANKYGLTEKTSDADLSTITPYQKL